MDGPTCYPPPVGRTSLLKILFNKEGTLVEENKTKEEVNSSKSFQCCVHHGNMKFIVCAIGGLILLGGAFCLGRVSSRNDFSHQNFGRAIAMRNERGQVGGDGKTMMRNRLDRGHLVGSITKIDGNNLTVKINNADIAVIVSDSTSFSKAGNIAKLSDLSVGNTILIVGSSNSQGQISATSITIN